MIAYLDTSSVVKLYVEEDGSAGIRALVAEADAVATAAVAYAETRAAFARLRREKRLSAAELRRMKQAFEADWDRYVVVQVTEAVCRHAGDLAERRGLRGFDAVHLAAYLALARTTTLDIRFSTFDLALNRSATRETRRRAGPPRTTSSHDNR